MKGDVRPHSKGDGRWQRYDGKRWRPKCEAGGCKVQPLFGDPADGVRRRCRKHRAEGDEDVKHRRCEAKGCKTIPSFGDAADGVAHRCSAHRAEGDEDVKSPRCEAKGCKVQPHFGDPADGLARRCRKHRAEGDENVNSPRCPDCLAEDGRITIASFGVAGSGRRTHCARHGRPRQLVPL